MAFSSGSRPFELFRSLRLPLLAAFAVAAIAGELSRRFEPVSIPWPVRATPVGLPEGSALVTANFWSRSIDFRFPTPDAAPGTLQGSSSPFRP